MDLSQREELRRWARRLAQAGTGRESQAAGRAIDLLVDEVEQLERELRQAREELEARARAERERERERAERARPDPERRLVVVSGGSGSAAAALRRPEELPEPDDAPPLPSFDPLPAELLELPPPRPRRPRPRRKRRALRLPQLPRPGRRTVLVAGAMALGAASLVAAARIVAPDLAAAGPTSGALVGAAAAKQLMFSVAGSEETLRELGWTVNGEDVTAQASLGAGRSLLPGSDLPDGEYEIVALVEGRLPLTSTRRTWTVSIDRVPPEVVVDPATAKGSPGRPLTLRGRVERGATLKALGAELSVQDGFFELALPEPPAKPVSFVATDAHGNTGTTDVPIELVPRLPPAPVRSVHVTFYAWANDELRSGIMRLIDEGRINSVELDLKDESGIVGFDADIPLAKQIGAIENVYDLEEAVDVLHAKGIYVVGRIVAFRDPIHAQAAWRRGWRNQVVQTPDGGLYGGYGGFTNFAHPIVRQYNIDVARVAAAAGVDDILYDYVRRPDGPTSSMVFPGLKGTAEASIGTFLGQARRQLKPFDVFLGASVFGVAATRPDEVAQDIPSMARNVDYIAPMLYPSHWGRGEYGVAHPNAQPYDITFRSLKDFQEQTRGTGARVVPWLQDFSLGVDYGPAEVRAQIQAAKDVGIEEWLLWDPLVTYTADGLDRHPLRPPIETRRAQPAQTGS